MNNTIEICSRNVRLQRVFGSRRKSPCEVSPPTRENLEDSLCVLSEELDALGIDPVIASNEDLRSVDRLTDVSSKLIDASWRLVHKYRSLMRAHDQLNDTHSKILNDNANLKKRVERLNEDLQKKQYNLDLGLERERRLKVQCDGLARDLKQEKEQTVKLKKQSRAKDSQHEHELRRIAQNGSKLRDQLERSIGSRTPKDKASEKARADQEEKDAMYKRTILRLEENNRMMLQEINDLKEALSLCTAGIELHMEASGIWTDTEA